MKKIIVDIEGMTCSACSNGLEKYLNKQKGIEANVNLVMQQAVIYYDENINNISDIEKFIKEAGFKSLGENHKQNNLKKSLYIIIIFSFISLFVMYMNMFDMFNLSIPNIFNKMVHPKIYILLLVSFSLFSIIWGIDIIKNGIKNIIYKMPNMDSLIGIGVIVNFLYSLYNSYYILINKGDISKIYFESVIMIILFVKIGRFIDNKNKVKASEAIKNLVTLTPKTANLIINKEIKEVTLDKIQKGNIVACKPGEKIAVDGVIVKGKTHTDESFINGESKPVSKNIGDLCFAGSINYDGYIEYEAVNIGKDSNISHIVDLVVTATNTKSPISRLADIISGYFVPIIFIISIISFILNYIISNQISQSIESLVTVLVVACPCALGLATPLAMVVSIGSASKKGLVIKTSEVIEQLNKIDTVVFDKTGTLTKGKLQIVDSKVKKDLDKKEILKLLQFIEAKSNHPLAKSICSNSHNLYEIDEFNEEIGKGISATINNKKYYAGNKKYLNTFKISNIFKKEDEIYSSKGESVVYFWNEKELLAIYGLRDELKDNIKNTINDLKQLNKKVIILSGDNKNTVSIIANELNIDKFYSDVSPKQKVDIIKKLNTNNNVLMIGDGINDSPALKTSAIGVSVSNGTDISNDVSDIIMMTDNMNRIIDLFKIGKKTIKIIKQNLFWALFYNICMIPLATSLLVIKINPMIASLAMTISSLTVVLNSLRLKK